MTDQKQKPPPAKASVVVVGGGISGLVAARDLVKAGKDVVVLEAQDEVGGRLKTFTRDNGKILQRGGETTGPIQAELHALAAEFGIETEPIAVFVNLEKGMQFVSVVDGERVVEPYPMSTDPDALAAYTVGVEQFDAVAKEIPPQAPWTAPNARELDRQSLGAWLDANIEDDGVRAAMRAGLTVWGDPYEVSMLYVASFVSRWGGWHAVEESLGQKFVGGSAQIPQKIAAELGDRVVLSAPVRKLTHTDAGVTVQTDRGTIAADAVIFAMAPGQCSKIEFEPALPVARDRLQTRALGNHGSKFYAIYDKPFWREEGLAGIVAALPFMDAWFDASPADESEGVLIGFQFASGPGATSRGESYKDEATVRAAALADLEICFGPQAASPKEFHFFAWYGSRWSDGCAMQLPPGVLSTVGHALREPVGRIFWAGAESEPIDYMEGAVVAGKRAASEAASLVA